MCLGENIRFLRTKKGYSQDDIANKLGYKSFTTIQKWESGVSEPPLKALKKLSELFNIDMNDLATKKLSTDTNNDNNVYYLDDATGIVIEVNLAKQEQTEVAKHILAYCNKLNDKGIKEAAKRVEELTYIPEYTADNNSLLNAAHELEGASKQNKNTITTLWTMMTNGNNLKRGFI